MAEQRQSIISGVAMCTLDLDVISRFASAAVGMLTALIAAAGGWVALQQFRVARLENRNKRFFELKLAFRSNPHFQEILDRVYGGRTDEGLPLSEKIEFMGFFEDIAYLVKTKQMPRELAFYMFGGDAMKAFETGW